MRDYSKFLLTDYFINLTGDPVSVYEESSGIVRTYYPQKRELPLKPQYLSVDSPFRVYYIVTRETLNRLRGKRSLSDLVVVEGESIGRGKRLIAHLIWAEDLKTRVLVCPTPASVSV